MIQASRLSNAFLTQKTVEDSVDAIVFHFTPTHARVREVVRAEKHLDRQTAARALKSAPAGCSGDGIQMFRTARAFGPRRPLVRGMEDLALVTDNDD